VVHGAWGSDISIAMVVSRSALNPADVRDSRKFPNESAPRWSHITPKYAHAGPYGEELAGWLTLLVGRGKRRFEKGFPGWDLPRALLFSRVCEATSSAAARNKCFHKSPRVAA
jgi:hypothetical protein